MTPEMVIRKLVVNKNVFKYQLSGFEGEQIYWRPAENKWCMLEIVSHLLDEEKEDFKSRLHYTLFRPDEEWPKIDPHCWPQDRKYMNKDYNSVLEEFIKEREKSIIWLKSLANIDWNRFYVHPVTGKMTASLLLMNWLAHDFFHIRQINRYNFEHLQQKSAVDLSYAGKW